MDFSRILRSVQNVCAEHGAPLAVVGGLALQAYGVARFTVDLDVATTRASQDALVRFFEDRGYETVHRSAGYSNHVHPNHADGRVDVIYVDAETADKLFAEAAAFELFPGLTVAVPSAEHLIAMKVLAIKNDPSRRFQDLADIQRLLRATDLAPERVRGYFLDHDLLAMYDELRQTL